MLIRIDPARSTPLADQIAGCVRRGIADGTVTTGERLPGARDLAASLQVSIHTVLAGYQQLRDEGLIELRRGRGATVSGGTPAGWAAGIDLADDELIALLRDTAARSG